MNCCGIFDVLTHDPSPRPVNIEALQVRSFRKFSLSKQSHQPTSQYQQQEDLIAFGRLVMALCTRSVVAPQTLSKALESIARNYSSDVKNVVLFLISKPAPNKVSTLRSGGVWCAID